MAKKSGEKAEGVNSSREGLGIVGFTLGVISILNLGLGLLGIWFSFLTGGMSLFSLWATSLIGLIFCYRQQKEHKTKFAKIGLVLNMIVLLITTGLIAYSIPAIIKYYGASATGAVTA